METQVEEQKGLNKTAWSSSKENKDEVRERDVKIYNTESLLNINISSIYKGWRKKKEKYVWVMRKVKFEEVRKLEHRRHLVYFKAVCVYTVTAVPVRNNAKATLKQTGKDRDWTSPESEFGWDLGTTGSVLVSALSQHSQSHPHPQLDLHPSSHLEPARGLLLSDTSADVLALMLSPRGKKTIQWSKTKPDIFESI